MAEEKEPSTKYLSAASPDSFRLAFMAASTYRAMDMISRPRKITMRSLASPMTTAPDADANVRTWNSGPTTFSRTIHPSPTRAATMTAHDTRMAMKALKPSWITAPSMATWGPLLCTWTHWTMASDNEANPVSTVMVVAVAWSMGRRTTELAASISTAPPRRTISGRIEK